MTTEEAIEYEKLSNELQERIDGRATEISILQKRLKTVKSIDELEKLNARLDILMKEVRLDQELNEDILNGLEVDHFLEHGNGQNFDPEY